MSRWLYLPLMGGLCWGGHDLLGTTGSSSEVHGCCSALQVGFASGCLPCSKDLGCFLMMVYLAQS